RVAPTEPVGKAIELQSAARSVRRFVDKRYSITDKARPGRRPGIPICLGKELDAVVDRCDRAAQLMAQARCQQLQYTQIDSAAHCGMPAFRRQSHLSGRAACETVHTPLGHLRP